MESDLHVYRLHGTDCVAAESEMEAWQLWCASVGERFEDYDLSEIERVSDDARWSINFDDVPTGLTDPKAKLSANEWAALLGKGVLCSTEY